MNRFQVQGFRFKVQGFKFKVQAISHRHSQQPSPPAIAKRRIKVIIYPYHPRLSIQKKTFWRSNLKKNQKKHSKSLQIQNKAVPLHPQSRNNDAQMAESVDALVSNTSGFTSIPVRPRVWVPRKPLDELVKRLFFVIQVILIR